MAANAPSASPTETTATSINGQTPLDDTSQSTSLPKDISGFIAARLELATIEAKEAATHTANKATNGIILAICVFFTWSLFLAGLTGALAQKAEECLEGKMDNLPGWAAILFVLAIIHGLGALIFLGQLKKKPSSPLFELSLQEIEHDKQWLTKNK